MKETNSSDSRRDFLRGSSLMLASAIPASIAAATHGLRADVPLAVPVCFRIGLVGCGKRGVQACAEALAAMGQQGRLTALADVFGDRMQQASRSLKSKFPEQYGVEIEARFAGLQAVQRLCLTDVDLVILATPPRFRPEHTAEVVLAGKHLFAEKPIAVDAAGVERFLEAANQAHRQGTALAVGLQRRFSGVYVETIERLQGGAIGRLLHGRAFCNTRSPSQAAAESTSSEFEQRLRNWRAFESLSGGPVVEEHVHGLDVFNWILGEHPRSANSVNDTLEFLYPDGFRLFSQTQVSHHPHSSGERIYGTAGSCDIAQGKIYNQHDQLIWRSESDRSGYANQFEDLLNSIARGEARNDGSHAAEATRTAILGRSALAAPGVLNSWNE